MYRTVYDKHVTQNIMKPWINFGLFCMQIHKIQYFLYVLHNIYYNFMSVICYFVFFLRCKYIWTLIWHIYVVICTENAEVSSLLV